MTPEELKKIERKFYSYTDAFISEASDPGPYRLKQEHTLEVCSNMDMLTESIVIPLSDRTLARAAALLHDIGRFPQYKMFGTFSDPLSKNHAALGIGIIVKEKILTLLPQNERRLILRAVALHNRPKLPETADPELLRLARLLRDADKLDIYRVMTNLYLNGGGKNSGYITHNLPDDGLLPDALIDMLIAEKRPPLNLITTLNAMKLFQLSMIYDLNFAAAFERIKEKQVVGLLVGAMPDSSKLDVLKNVMNDFIDRKIAESSD